MESWLEGWGIVEGWDMYREPDDGLQEQLVGLGRVGRGGADLLPDERHAGTASDREHRSARENDEKRKKGTPPSAQMTGWHAVLNQITQGPQTPMQKVTYSWYCAYAVEKAQLGSQLSWWPSSHSTLIRSSHSNSVALRRRRDPGTHVAMRASIISMRRTPPQKPKKGKERILARKS